MPDRYHIHTAPVPAHFRRVGKYGSVDWREDCSRCTNCVKLRCCYDVYKHESAHNRDPIAPVQTLYECKACLSCVQGCTKGLIGISMNPEFLELGDEYWKPDMLASTWNQSDTGKVPVSGAGYRGPFQGYGFDSIWTDMSEIVRPTRDGIHGREYISTAVDIGPKPMRLSFSPEGRLLTPPSRLLEIQIPAILDMPLWPVQSRIAQARAAAAKQIKTLAIMTIGESRQVAAEQLSCVVPLITDADLQTGQDILTRVGMTELQDCADLAGLARRAQAINPELIIAGRLLLRPSTGARIVDLAREGIKVFHLCADLHGRERLDDEQPGRHIKDVLREVHGRLVQEGLRDEITVIVSGGIALAEHMAKAIICGADLVAIGTPLLVALGCRVCRNAHSGSQCTSSDCPAEIDSVEAAYCVRRIINLMGAWHSQLIEVLGAMGIRELRRLRGEVGRAIFVEDIEKEAFGHLYRLPHIQVPA